VQSVFVFFVSVCVECKSVVHIMRPFFFVLPTNSSSNAMR